ncbi:MAG: gliding motility-associated C-terminal domain-containing protein [Flavobacteriales bacterium]|nr:gliding motility-associated C-terminal domain-containing protein [Flavobacteriales bacterium]
MKIANFYKILFSFFTILYAFSGYAQTPSNDDCADAILLKIGSGNFGIGTYQSDSISIDSATTQLSEFFHNSLVTAGNDKKSIWYKFYLPSRRGVSLELKQNANKIAIKDCGFTTYLSGSCLPGSVEATNAKLTTLNQFGSSFHPCMEPGWYLVQVSAKARALGKVYMEITTSFPYEHASITNAKYDVTQNAYFFGNDVIGKPGENSKYIDVETGCYSIDDSSELFKPIGSNYAAYNQSAWFVFQAQDHSDYSQINYRSVSTCFGVNDTVAYRLYKGDCRDTGKLIILDSNYHDFRAGNTCYSTCSDRVNHYKCYFDSGQYYSFQIIFHRDLEKTVRVTISNNNSAYDTMNSKPVTGIAKNLGDLLGTSYHYFGFSCSSYMSDNACNNAIPANGIQMNNLRYTLNSWAKFSLTQQTRLTVQLYAGINNNYRNFQYLGFRLFKGNISNNCSNIDTSQIIYSGKGNVQYIIDCLEPGNYAFQFLGTDSLNLTSNFSCTGTYHLGRDFRINIDADRLPVRNLFSLYSKGEADSINVIGNTISPLPKWKNPIYGKTDTIACNEGIIPEHICDTSLTRTSYRVLKIGDVTGDGVPDSGYLNIFNLPYTYYTGEQFRLYKGNALTLRDSQSISKYPDVIKGLKPYTNCFGGYNTTNFVCVEPGEYTLVSFSNNNSIGSTESPSFVFQHGRSHYDTYAKAEFVDSLNTYKTYTSKRDTFTCLNNPDTIDGISCGVKNSYHVFRVDSVFKASFYNNNYYYSNGFSLFYGDIRKGKSGLKVFEDANGKWSCIYYSRTTTSCKPLTPGWYTVVLSDNGPSYDSAYNNDPSKRYLYNSSKYFSITTSKNTAILSKYERPHKAAFLDSLINNNKPLSYDTNYNTKSMPQNLAKFVLPTERFECDLDTPLNHFPKNALCDTGTTDIAYYVFTLNKNSFVRIKNNVNYTAKIKLYKIDVRKDSAKLATEKPIQDCNYNPAYLEYCNLTPGRYTLVYFIKRQSGQIAVINGEMYIDSVAYSRFDHAKNAYDFGRIPGNNTYYDGKIGDVHPNDPGLPPSHDLVTCKTGAQYSDPAQNTCFGNYNPNVYLSDTNTVMFPTDSIFVYNYGKQNYYPYYGYGPSRNLWYTFTVRGKGIVHVKLSTIAQKYHYTKDNNFRFTIYESDEDGNLGFDTLRSLGRIDSTLADGLKYVADDRSGYYYCYGGSDYHELFAIPACDSIKTRRFYILVTATGYNSYFTTANLHVSMSVKYDSLYIPPTKFDYYSTANDINGVNYQNLLLNWDANTYPYTGWSYTGNWQRYNTITPRVGTHYFWPYYSSTIDTTELVQTVDVSHFIPAINAGKATAEFGAYIQSKNKTVPDEGRLILEFLNDTNGVLSVYKSSFVSHVDQWVKESIVKTIPPKTKKVRVSLQARDASNDNYFDSYFDEMSLYIKVDSSIHTQPLKSNLVYRGTTDNFSTATLDSTDYQKIYTGCSGDKGSVWYKFTVDSTGYLYYNYFYTKLSGSTVTTNYDASLYYLRLYKNLVPGDSLKGLVYLPQIGGNSSLSQIMGGYSYYNCVSPGTYYLQINKCNRFECNDDVYPQLYFNFHNGDFCHNAIEIQLDTLESKTATTLVNCHTMGTDFGEDGSDLGCLFGPKGYKSSWFKVIYTDTTKSDLEFKLGEFTSAKPDEIRYRTYYGTCNSLTPAPCNNNALTEFTIDCIKNGTYYVQVVTPESATGNIDLTVETKENVDTTCFPINIFQPNAVFAYNTGCPENIVEFINTSSRGDSIVYHWDFGYNNSTSNALNPVFAYPALSTEQTYKVKLNVTHITRGGVDSIEITVSVPFATFVKVSNSDTGLCAGDSVLLTGSISHGKGIWNTGDTSKSITVKRTGWYYYMQDDSPQLLTNGSAEKTIATGWTVASGSWNFRGSSPYPKDSSRYFYATNSKDVAEIYQIVDVSYDSVLIDKGLAKTSLVSFIQSYPETEPDQCQIILEYLDTAGNLTGYYQSGLLFNVSEWQKLVHSRTTPAKTRKLKVRLQSINSDNTTNNYAFFDKVVLKMRSACDYIDSVYVQVNPNPIVDAGKDATFCWYDSVLVSPKVDYYDPYWVYEPFNDQFHSGNLSKDASYTPSDKFLYLNQASTSSVGTVEWELDSMKISDSLELGFEFQSGFSSTCINSVFGFYLFNSQTPTGVYQNNGGYTLYFNENDNRISIYWLGSNRRNIYLNKILDDEKWHKVKVYYYKQRFIIYFDDVLVDNFLDNGTRSQSGIKAGLIAANNFYSCPLEHKIRRTYISRTNPYHMVIPALNGRKNTFVWNDMNTDTSRWISQQATYKVQATDKNKCLSNIDSIQINNIKLYDSLLSSSPQICEQLDTFRLIPIINGGKFYGNSNLDSSGLINVGTSHKGSNVFYYTVTDTFGCKYVDTGNYTIDSLPLIKIDPAQKVCRNEGPFFLKVNSNQGYFYGGSYIDSNGLFYPSRTSLSQNKVYYRTKGNYCIGVDSILVAVDSMPDASIIAAGPFCKNSGIQTLKPKVNSGGKFSGGIYLDSTGKFDPNLASIGNNKIYYTFTDGNSCTNMDSITVTVNGLPNAAIKGYDNFCLNGNKRIIEPRFNFGGKFYGGSYIDSSGNFDPSVAGPGLKKVHYTYTDANSCTSVDSTTLKVDTIPRIGLLTMAALCSNEQAQNINYLNKNLTLSFSGGRYITSNGIFIPDSASIGFNKIYVIGTDKNTCSGMDSMSVEVIQMPDAEIVQPAEICENTDSLIVSAKFKGGFFSGNAFISDSGLFSPKLAGQGNYPIFYTLINRGCTSIDTVILVVRPVPNVDLSVDPSSACEPAYIKFKGTPGYTYEWTSNSTVIGRVDEFTTLYFRGNYDINIKVTNAFGCSSFYTRNLIIHPKPEAKFSYSPSEIFIGSTDVMFENQSVGTIVMSEWSESNSVFSSEFSPTHAFYDTGFLNIRLVVTNEKGCMDTAYGQLYVIDDFKCFLPNAFSPNGDDINELFYPIGIGISRYEMTIYNRWGEKLYEGEEPWNGIYLGDVVPIGQYLYMIKIYDRKNNEHRAKGTMTVVR